MKTAAKQLQPVGRLFRADLSAKAFARAELGRTQKPWRRQMDSQATTAKSAFAGLCQSLQPETRPKKPGTLKFLNSQTLKLKDVPSLIRLNPTKSTLKIKTTKQTHFVAPAQAPTLAPGYPPYQLSTPN
jgi:hypothetical protein